MGSAVLPRLHVVPATSERHEPVDHGSPNLACQCFPEGSRNTVNMAMPYGLVDPGFLRGLSDRVTRSAD